MQRFYLVFNKNIKQLSCAKVLKLMVLYNTYLSYFVSLKVDFKKFSTLLTGSFYIELTFLSQESTFPKNVEAR